MKIIETTTREMGQSYADLYLEIFGEWTHHRNPDIVYLFVTDEKDDIIGFASGIVVRPQEIHLLWGGEREQYRGFSSKKRLREIRDYLHKKGFKYITTSVENTNSPMLRLYLSIGYLIFGMKTSTDNHIYIQLIHLGE